MLRLASTLASRPPFSVQTAAGRTDCETGTWPSVIAKLPDWSISRQRSCGMSGGHCITLDRPWASVVISAAFSYHAASRTNLETSVMSTVDANRVILTGENSVIRLNSNDSDVFTTNATFWRILSSPRGPGNVLYLKSELTEARWRIYSDNIAIARWLQSTV